jgi:hypothetical protein
MAGQGTRATALDYNAIHNNIAAVMGVGSGQTGYGQAIASTPAAPGEIISTTKFSALRTDLSRARVHQTNSAIIDGLASISANRGSPWQTLQSITAQTIISEAIRDQYLQFSDGVTLNKDAAAAAQLTPNISVASASRTTNWGGASQVQSLSHTITVTFNGYTQGSLTVSAADHARCFFNAGGTIQISASRTGTAVTTKDTDWTNMLSGFGNLTFGSTTSSISGTINSPGSVQTTRGFFNVTVGAAAVALMTQASSVTQYAENRYIVTVARPTANTIAFAITFQDNDTGDQSGLGPSVDEQVTGTLTSTVRCTRPSGSNVDVPAPSGTSSPASL